MILATVLVVLGSVFLHATQREHGVKTDTSAVVTAFGVLSSVLLVYRVLIVLPSGAVIEQKLGAVLGLLCALGIVVGGLESIDERRRRHSAARHRPRRQAATGSAETAGEGRDVVSGARFDLRRLRHGEVLAALAGAAVIVLMFATAWFGAAHGSAADGWRAMPVARWLVLPAGIGGLTLAVAQAAFRAPAVPVTASLIVTVLGAVTTVVLLIRLLTSVGTLKPGAPAGLLAVALMTAGAFMSMRQEGGWVPGVDRPVPTVPLAGPEHP